MNFNNSETTLAAHVPYDAGQLATLQHENRHLISDIKPLEIVHTYKVDHLKIFLKTQR